MTARRGELAANLAAVHERIDRACLDAGRDPAELTLIVVTKTYPVEDVVILAELGVREFGENRHPEAGRKFAALAELVPDADVRLHFLGGLQTNKAGAVARYADVVHSVDRVRLVEGLSRGALAAGRELGALVEVDFSGEPGRAGVAPEGVGALAAEIAAAPGLRLDGVMTVAPLGVDPASCFAELVAIGGRLRAVHPAATMISAGMSGDLEQAVAAGATHLRVGRSILGERPEMT